MRGTSALTEARGTTIPDFTLPTPLGRDIASRSFYMRQNLVILLLPEVIDDELKAWLTDLFASSHAIPEGDARVLTITTASNSQMVESMVTPEAAERVLVLIDSDHTVPRRFNVDPERTTLVVTDRYGTVFNLWSAGDSHSLPDPGEIPEWVEFIACQCS